MPLPLGRPFKRPYGVMVVAVTWTLFCAPTGLPFELEATPMAIAATAPTPIRIQPAWPIWACLTPAGLPAASGPELSAAKAADAIRVVDKATAIRVRMFPLKSFYFFCDYTQKSNRHNAV